MVILPLSGTLPIYFLAVSWCLTLSGCPLQADWRSEGASGLRRPWIQAWLWGLTRAEGFPGSSVLMGHLLLFWVWLIECALSLSSPTPEDTPASHPSSGSVRRAHGSPPRHTRKGPWSQRGLRSSALARGGTGHIPDG